MDNSRSYKNRNREINGPEKLYGGKELKMAQAIFNGDVNKVEIIIKNEHLSANGMSTKGEITFLTYAIMMEDLKVMEKLLELGADPNLASPNKNKTAMPISYAVARHNIKMLELLFKYKVNPNPEIGKLPIDEALMGDNGKETIEYLVAHGANINLQGYIDGRTVIQTAINLNKLNYINYFLDNDAKPLLIDANGRCMAFDIQEEINGGRLNDYGLKEYNKIKERLINEFHVKFPLKQEKRKGLEFSIKRYEDLTSKSKLLLGNMDKEVIEELKDSLAKGVNGLGFPLD